MVKTKGQKKNTKMDESNSQEILSEESIEQLSDMPEPQLIMPAGLEGADEESKTRVDLIQESHTLLKGFNAQELKILINLKRNTSPKAWSLREDLIVLTLPMSNREIAEVLKGRNKEAVKKRLQLLKSKGLIKRGHSLKSEPDDA
jgi:hypothetical protein